MRERAYRAAHALATSSLPHDPSRISPKSEDDDIEIFGGQSTRLFTPERQPSTPASVSVSEPVAHTGLQTSYLRESLLPLTQRQLDEDTAIFNAAMREEPEGERPGGLFSVSEPSLVHGPTPSIGLSYGWPPLFNDAPTQMTPQASHSHRPTFHDPAHVEFDTQFQQQQQGEGAMLSDRWSYFLNTYGQISERTQYPS